MKRFFHAALWAVMAFCLCTGQAFAAYKQEYKLSIVPNATSGWGMTATYFVDLVREKTNGRINIKVYPGAQLTSGKQNSELMLVRRGAIDFALASPINWSPQIKELNLTNLPFFVANNPDRHKAVDAIEAGKSGEMLKAAIEKAGVVFIGWCEHGYRELTTSKGPITKPADMAGMKIRVCGAPIFNDTFTALGANPQAINWSETITGFQQGIVDGQENPTNGINVNLKLWTWHKYYTDWHYTFDPLFLTANDKVWKSFSAEDQKIIKECAKETEKYSKAIARVGLDDGTALKFLESINKVPAVTDAYKMMEEHGMTVIKFTPEMIADFYKATQSVRDKWTGIIGEELVKAAEEDMKKAQ